MKTEKILHEVRYRGYRIEIVEITDEELQEGAWCIQYRVYGSTRRDAGTRRVQVRTFDSYAEARAWIDEGSESNE